MPHLWIGVQFSMASMKTSATVDALIPHPILFNAPRSVQGSIDNVQHKEQNVHVGVMYAVPAGAVDIRLMAGPTFFNLKQDFVSKVSVNESYPFDTATFASATTTQLSGTAVGFNAGADISHAFTPQVALGGLIRYSTANVKFTDSTVGSHTVKAGGLEVAAGIRLRF
jgi:opacity protein-like surface antigen